MSMTVAEKEALQKILSNKIKDRVEDLKIEAEVEFQEMQNKAEAQAVEQLGIQEEFIAAGRLYREFEEKEAQLKIIWRGMAEKLGSKDPGWRPRGDVMGKVDKKAEIIKRSLMADHPIGKQILELRAEKKEMLGTIWLATSTKQVKDLWSHLDNLLGERMTQLEKDAMKIDPAKE